MSDQPKVGQNTGNRGLGRPKGSLNKTTQTAKEAIATAADALGGADRLVEWAKEDPKNEHAFWASIYPKLLPLQLTGDVQNPLSIHVKIGGNANTDA